MRRFDVIVCNHFQMNLISDSTRNVNKEKKREIFLSIKK